MPEYPTIKAKVMKLLKENPRGLTGASVGRAVGLTSGSISKYLGMMYAEKLIDYREVGAAKLWFLSEELRLSEKERSERVMKYYASQDLAELCKFMSIKDGELTGPLGIRNVITPAKTIALIQAIATETVGKEQAAKIFYLAGKKIARECAKFLKSKLKIDGKLFFEEYIKTLPPRGWGQFKIDTITDEKIAAKWIKSIFGSELPQTGVAVDHFGAGAAAGIAEVAFGGTWKGEEVKCVAKGDKYCEFVITRQNKQMKKGSHLRT